jgi:hypothetical protein
MNTTAIFVEILVIGMQAIIWIVLLVLSLVGYDWLSAIPVNLDKWSVFVTILLIAYCYTLGIIVDRLADGLFILTKKFMLVKPRNLLLRINRVRQTFEESAQDHRMETLASEGGATVFLEYIRSRLRILRATVLNLFLITITSLLFISSRCGSLGCASPMALATTILGVGLFLTAIAYVAWAMLQSTYDERLNQIKQLLEAEKQKR